MLSLRKVWGKKSLFQSVPYLVRVDGEVTKYLKNCVHFSDWLRQSHQEHWVRFRCRRRTSVSGVQGPSEVESARFDPDSWVGHPGQEPHRGCGQVQLWARLIGEAISISTQNWDRDFLTSQLILTLWDRSRWPSQFFPKCRDRSRWPSQSFKIFEVSWEKSGFTWLIPTLPNFSRFFWPKKAGKNWGKLGIGHPDTTQISGRVGLPYKIPIPICQKDEMAILISISTLPDFCRDIIPLEISRP